MFSYRDFLLSLRLCSTKSRPLIWHHPTVRNRPYLMVLHLLIEAIPWVGGYFCHFLFHEREKIVGRAARPQEAGAARCATAARWARCATAAWWAGCATATAVDAQRRRRDARRRRLDAWRRWWARCTTARRPRCETSLASTDDQQERRHLFCLPDHTPANPTVRLDWYLVSHGISWHLLKDEKDEICSGQKKKPRGTGKRSIWQTDLVKPKDQT